jgi:RNA polymerase sigma factor (TIGR02999 family)
VGAIPPPTDVTYLLRAWRAGDDGAGDRLVEVLYQELHDMARRRLSRERAGGTLQTTALVHEAYLRLVGQDDLHWESRAHFFAIAARAMRHILVDRARARGSGSTASRILPAARNRGQATFSGWRPLFRRARGRARLGRTPSRA